MTITESEKYPSRLLKNEEVIEYIQESIVKIEFFFLGYTGNERAQLSGKEDREAISAYVYGKTEEFLTEGLGSVVGFNEFYVFFSCDFRMYKVESLEDAINIIYELGDRIKKARQKGLLEKA